MVVNTDRAHEQGTHWVAFFLPRMDTVYYWDSLAIASPPSKGIRDFLRGFDQVFKNYIRFQRVGSDLCGQYCIVFCYYISLGFSFNQFLSLMYRIRPNTDLFVYEFVNKLVK